MKNGLKLVGAVLFGCFLMGFLVGGFGQAFGTIRESNLSSLPRPAAFAVGLCSFALISSMVQRWAKYLAGWVWFGVLNSLLVASSGHALNNPSVPIERWFALSMALVWFTSSLASLRFTKSYQLTLLDKSALLTWVLAFTVFANFALASKPTFALVTLAIGSFGLVIAWYYQRYHRVHRGGSSQLRSPHSVEG